MADEDILEKLSKEERLELLERLIKGAAQEQEENLTLEERVERLEKMFGPGCEPVVRIVRAGVSCCN